MKYNDKKYLLRIISFLLIITMFCALALPASAIVISPDFAPRYVQVDDELRNTILEYGIEVNDSTQFRIVNVLLKV